MRYFRFEYMIYIYIHMYLLYMEVHMYIYMFVCIYICLYLYIYIFVCIYTYVLYNHMTFTYIRIHITYTSSFFKIQSTIGCIFFRKNLTHTWQVSTCRCDIDRAHHSCVGNCQWFCPNDWKVKDDQFLSFFLFFFGTSWLIQDMELPRLGQFLALFSSQECQMDFGLKWSFELPYFFFHFNARTWIW